MITVFQQLSLYCQAKGLTAPTKDDLTNAGNIVSHHFRRFWVPKKYIEVGSIIPDAGFIVQQEGDNKHVVAGYPDIFKDEMNSRFDMYFENKAKEKPVIKEKKPPKPGAYLAYQAKPGK